jgi:hypothetical protein
MFNSNESITNLTSSEYILHFIRVFLYMKINILSEIEFQALDDDIARHIHEEC